MADEDFTFTEGIDPTSVFAAGQASVLLQLIREAVPNPYRGMLIYGASTPATSGDYAWQKRCVWVKTDDWTFYYFNDDLGSWESLFAAIPDDSITTAMLGDGIVTLAKLAVGAGTAGQIVRINSGATGFEFVAPADAIPAGALAVTKLAAGANDTVLMTVSGVVGWQSLASKIASTLTASAILTPAMFTSPGAASYARFLSATPAGALGWTSFNLNTMQAEGSVNVDMLAPGANGKMLVSVGGVAVWGSAADLPNGSIPLARLVAGTNTHVLTMEGGVPVWKAPVAPSTTYENFCARLTGTRTVSGANFVAFDALTTAEIDDGGWEATAVGQYRVVNTGIYLVRATLRYNGSWSHDLEIRVNGSAVRQYASFVPSGSGQHVVVIEAMIDVTAAATDEVSINLANNSLGAGSEELLAGSTFTIQRIGDT